MEALFAALEATQFATQLRLSRFLYPLVNAGHILGVALLVGAILPLDLRVLGLWRSVPVEPLDRVLRPMAACGLALAAATGFLLFSVSAREYWATPIFPGKMGAVALGAANAILLLGRPLRSVSPLRRRIAALASAGLWIAALVMGRWIGYVK